MKKFIFSIISVSLILLMISCGNKDSQESKPVINPNSYKDLSNLQKDLHSVAQNLTPSVVFIGTEKDIKKTYMDPFDFFFGDPGSGSRPREQHFKQKGLGSGVIYRNKGDSYFIVTNNHVVEGADTIKVSVDQKKFYEGKVVGSDSYSDIAIVKINTDDKLQTATFGDSGKIQPGDFAIAIGNPYGLVGTMTFGIISAIGRTDISGDGEKPNLGNFIQTDAAINPGNSGGPLLNINGEVIGINTMIYSQSGGNVGIGFAIPSNQAKKIADEVIDKGKSSIEHGYLGVYFQEITEENSKTLGLGDIKYGVLVSKVEKSSPAAKSGIKPGDVLLEANGKKIEKSSDLTITVGTSSPGTSMNFRILRDGKELNVTAVLGSRNDNSTAGLNQSEIKEYGMEISPLTDELKKKAGIPSNISGVIVTGVDQNGKAGSSGIQSGDVIEKINNKLVSSVSDVEKILNGSKSPINFFIIFRDGEEFIATM